MLSIKRIKNKFLLVFLVIGFVVLFISTLLLLLKIRSERPASHSSDQQVGRKGQEVAWDNYINYEYNYSLSIPKFLRKRELEGGELYLNFIRFEETDFSSAKGVAVGVRKETLEEEVKRLKEELVTSFEVSLLEQKDIKVDGYNAIRLEYKPKDKKELELRTIVVVNNGIYSYSISTVPEQIDKIINSFKFL